MNHAFRRTLLASALLAVMTAGAATSVAEPRQRDRDRGESSEAAERFPEATREAPDAKASARASKKLQKMMDLHAGQSTAEAAAIAEEILADEDTNNYEKALAAQTAAQIAYEAGDLARASEMFGRVIELDALDNTNHYLMMLNLAQLQQQQKQYDQALATYDRFFSETGSTDPEAVMMKGQTLYLAKRYPEAAELMEQAIAATSEPKPEWQALLMQVHALSGNADEAVKMAEQVAAAKPDDKRAQLNLAVVYQQAGMNDKVVAVLERMHAAGQLTEANEYHQLYATYLNMDGGEQKAIDVINDGLAKGILGEDFNTSVALAQAYYFTDQIEPAIAAYRTAAPLDEDGSTWLNLAKVLLNEGRNDEAGAAAKQALAKGIDAPGEAESIIKRAAN